MLLIGGVEALLFELMLPHGNLRTTRNSRAAIASTENAATAIRNLFCSRQSASAA